MKYIPHEYQSYATKRILDTPYLGLFLEMGLGKTVSSLTAINELIYDRFELGKILVIAPLRVAEDTWEREIAKWDHLKHLTISKILGSVEQRRKALRTESDIYIINRENVNWLVAEFGDSWPFEIVFIDELSSFKSSKSQRFRALKRVRPFIKRLVGLTGTPAPNSLIDLWPQIYLMDMGARLGKTITGYRERYFTPGASNKHVVYEWKEKAEAEDAIYNAISDITVSMKSEDWLELPEKITVDKKVRLSDSSKKLYKQLERDLLLPFVDGNVAATSAAVLSNKLLQMASGAVYNVDKGVQFIHDAKLDALEDIVESANGKPVMVMYYYKHCLERLLKRFPKGRILRRGKEGITDIADWNNNKIPILFIHPKSAGHGLNLQDSNCQTVVWFDMVWSLEEYQQANARVYRQGQKHRVMIMHIVAEDTMDERVLKALADKDTGQEALMQAVKAQIENIRRNNYEI
mgnify:CR=1 FL=1